MITTLSPLVDEKGHTFSLCASPFMNTEMSNREQRGRQWNNLSNFIAF